MVLHYTKLGIISKFMELTFEEAALLNYLVSAKAAPMPCLRNEIHQVVWLVSNSSIQCQIGACNLCYWRFIHPQSTRTGLSSVALVRWYWPFMLLLWAAGPYSAVNTSQTWTLSLALVLEGRWPRGWTYLRIRRGLGQQWQPAVGAGHPGPGSFVRVPNSRIIE